MYIHRHSRHACKVKPKHSQAQRSNCTSVSALDPWVDLLQLRHITQHGCNWPEPITQPAGAPIPATTVPSSHATKQRMRRPFTVRLNARSPGFQQNIQSCGRARHPTLTAFILSVVPITLSSMSRYLVIRFQASASKKLVYKSK